MSSLYDTLSDTKKQLVQEELKARKQAARLSKTEAMEQLSLLQEELERRKCAADPQLWAQKRLGDTLWSGQIEILHAVRDHRRVAAMTCHDIGKSYDAAIAAAWWLDIHKPGEAFVVTTAPTGPQVKVILWKEIGRAHTRGQLKGRVNQMEWLIEVDGKEEVVALGRKPSDYSPTAFQGIHAPYVLVIVDEANGVRGPLWEAMDSLIANDGSKMLIIGNPDDPHGEFFENCKPGSGWFIVQIGAFDSPNFTGEELPKHILSQLIGRTYVEEKRRKWAREWSWTEDGTKCVPPEGQDPTERTNPFWQSKILGLFPKAGGAGSLIPLDWIIAAQQRTLEPLGENVLGLDVGASEDGDPSCLGHRIGGVFRILYEERQPDTMKTCGRLLRSLKDKSIGALRAQVDYIGVGRGVVDRAREEKEEVYPIQVGEASSRPEEYANLLAELWWKVRELFQNGQVDLDPEDEDLASELVTLQWEPDSRGRITVVYGDGPSPNRADALMLTFAPKPTMYSMVYTWGS